MFVATGTQHAMRMRHTVICGLPRSTVFCPPIISKRHDFLKSVIKHKICVLIFSTTFMCFDFLYNFYVFWFSLQLSCVLIFSTTFMCFDFLYNFYEFWFSLQLLCVLIFSTTCMCFDFLYNFYVFLFSLQLLCVLVLSTTLCVFIFSTAFMCFGFIYNFYVFWFSLQLLCVLIFSTTFVFLFSLQRLCVLIFSTTFMCFDFLYNFYVFWFSRELCRYSSRETYPLAQYNRMSNAVTIILGFIQNNVWRQETVFRLSLRASLFLQLRSSYSVCPR